MHDITGESSIRVPQVESHGPETANRKASRIGVVGRVGSAASSLALLDLKLRGCLDVLSTFE